MIKFFKKAHLCVLCEVFLFINISAMDINKTDKQKIKLSDISSSIIKYSKLLQEVNPLPRHIVVPKRIDESVFKTIGDFMEAYQKLAEQYKFSDLKSLAEEARIKLHNWGYCAFCKILNPGFDSGVNNLFPFPDLNKTEFWRIVFVVEFLQISPLLNILAYHAINYEPTVFQAYVLKKDKFKYPLFLKQCEEFINIQPIEELEEEPYDLEVYLK